MALESITYIGDLVPANPTAADPKSEGDDHIRRLKAALLASFAGFTGAVMVTGTDGGAANAYTLAPANALPGYAAKMVAVFAPTVVNTGACTLNISGLGVKSLTTVDGQPLVAGDLTVGVIYSAIYDGTRFRLTAITKNYVDQLAFNTVLPAQATNGGKFLKTSGASSSWEYPGISVANATVTTSTTLTASYVYVPVQMASLGQSVTLPAANTLTVGGPQVIIDNTKGAYPAGIRDNSGVLLMAVAPGGVAMVSVKDNSTAAGVWSVTGSNLEPGLVTIDQTFLSFNGSTILVPFVALDANTSIHFTTLASGFTAFVVDNTGMVLTVPVTVDGTASSTPKAVFRISATQAIVFYGATGTTNSAVVLTLSGTSPSLSVSVGTPATFTTTMGSNWSEENSVNSTHIAQLTSTSYIAGYSGGVVAIPVSGSAVSIGAAATFVTASLSNRSPIVYALTATTALVLYYAGTTNIGVYAAVVTVAGTISSVGTAAALGQTVASASPSLPPSSVLLSPTKAIVAITSVDSGPVYAGAVSITGTSVAWGTAVQVESTAHAAIELGTYIGATGTRFNPRIWAVGSNTAAMSMVDTAGLSRALVLTESGGVLTVGAKLIGSYSTALSGASGFGALGAQTTSDFITINQIGAAGAWRTTLIPHKISGTTITYGVSQPLRELSPIAAATAFPTTRLSQGDYLVMGANAQALPVFRSNGDALSKRGSIALPNLSGPTSYPLQAVSSNRIVLIGLTQGSGSAPTQTLRIFNIEVAA